jgi:hypothetical protein
MTRQPSPRGGHRPRHGRRCRPSSPRLPRERGRVGVRVDASRRSAPPPSPRRTIVPRHPRPAARKTWGRPPPEGAMQGAGETSRRCLALLPYTVELPLAASRGGQTPPCRRRREGERNEWTDFRGED